MLDHLVIPLAATLVLEYAAAYLLLNDTAVAKNSLLVNLITNPCLNLILWGLGSYLGFTGYWLLLLFLEIVVVAFEAWWYHMRLQEPGNRALLLSFALNAMSFGIGMLLQAFGLL
ncbi:MAG: hypothetical protein LBR25_09745 [Erysipelotrichaceae bacterium]|jgi:hypothetical protein|nr:hypothetical protein [Erysipelotrichaceae bacterium]